MPKKTNSPMQSVPIAIDKERIAFVERVGEGNNFSQKLRYVLDHYAEIVDTLVNREGNLLRDDAICVFQRTADGETVWADEIPFEVDMRKGWQAIAAAAAAADYITQEIYEEETGVVQVWCALRKGRADCALCKKQIIEIIDSH